MSQARIIISDQQLISHQKKKKKLIILLIKLYKYLKEMNEFFELEQVE